MAIIIPPVPQDQKTSFIWTEWFKSLRKVVNDFIINIVLTFSTRGTYLTAATVAAQTSVFVKDSSVFPSSGTAVVFDTTNDRDEFTYTGVGNGVLTGVSGVLAHNANASVIPKLKSMTISSAVNEMRFYGDRGDGTIEELASIGIKTSGSDQVIGSFGSTSNGNSRVALQGISYSSVGISGQSTTGSAGQFTSASNTVSALFAQSTGTGAAFQADGNGTGATGVFSASNSGYAFYTNGNSTVGHMRMTPLAGRPTTRTTGGLAVIYTTGGSADARTATPKLMIDDGTDWRLVEDYTIWTG